MEQGISYIRAKWHSFAFIKSSHISYKFHNIVIIAKKSKGWLWLTSVQKVVLFFPWYTTSVFFYYTAMIYLTC